MQGKKLPSTWPFFYFGIKNRSAEKTGYVLKECLFLDNLLYNFQKGGGEWRQTLPKHSSGYTSDVRCA
jgi:hypothetical protein